VEEDNDGGQAPPERWEPTPPSPRAAVAAEEQVPGAGAGAPAAEWSTEEAAHVAEAPAHAAVVPTRAAEASRGVTVAALAVASALAEPSRKRKRGFTILR
jgi:hypothetical protein